MDNNELQHHGILGMKWGVRRSKAQLARAKGGSSAKKTTQPAGKDEPEKKTTTKSSSESLTNKELKERVERIKLERELAQLTAKQKSAGRKFVEDVITNAGKAALTAFATKKLTDILNAKFGGPEDKDKDKGKDKGKPNASSTPASETSAT